MKKPSKSSTKSTYAKYLKCKKPNRWASLICETIHNEQLQAWVASIVMWNYPKGLAWESELSELSDQYRSNKNDNKAIELQKAFFSIGLPYFPAKNDDAISSEKKLVLAHNNITSKQRVGNENAQACCNYHASEVAAGR